MKNLGYNDPSAIENRRLVNIETNSNKLVIDFKCFAKTEHEKLELKLAKSAWKQSNKY